MIGGDRFVVDKTKFYFSTAIYNLMVETNSKDDQNVASTPFTPEEEKKVEYINDRLVD